MLCAVNLHQRAADHHLHRFFGREFLLIQHTDRAAVLHHSDTIGNLLHLVHAMGDEDDAHAAVAHLTHQAEQLGYLLTGETGRRFVHDEYSGIVRKRLGDLDHLLLRGRKCVHAGVRVDGKPQRVNELLALAYHARGIDHP